MTGDTARPLRGVINLSLSAAEYLHPNPLFGCHPLTAPLAAAFGTDFALILQQMQTGKKTSFIKSINGLKLQHSTQNTPKKNEAAEGSRRRGRGGGEHDDAECGSDVDVDDAATRRCRCCVTRMPAKPSLGKTRRGGKGGTQSRCRLKI